MANNLTQNKKKVQEVPQLALQEFSGLSLKLDFTNRDKNSWQTLDNFDLYVPGSLRKVLPAVLYGGPYGANILNCLEYYAQANNPAGGIRRLLGVGADGNVYDLASATPATPYINANYLLGTPVSIPTILQYPGYYVPFNIRSWTANTVYAQYDAVLEYGPNGILYVYALLTSGGTSGNNEPIWPASGSVPDNATTPTWSLILNGTTNDNSVVWTNRGQPVWQANHAYVSGNPIIDSNGNIEVVGALSGHSGAHQPNWPNSFSTPTSDHQIIWLCELQPTWEANTVYVLGDTIIDSNGNIQQVTTAGTSGSPGAGVTWTNVGVPNSNRFFSYFLAIFVPGQQPVRLVEWQYDPTSNIEPYKLTIGQMGCSPATVPPELSGIETTPNLNGYAPSAGRAYQWTYYNPNTLQESSPSPFVGKTRIIENDNSFASVTINGSILIPLPVSIKANTYTSYQSFYIAIPVSVLVPIIGQGYTMIRIYATQDGGTTFFLVNTLYDNNGNQISNSNGAIPIALLKSLSITNSWTDYFPLPEPQDAVPSVRIYEGSGPINFAPDPVNLGPAAWFQVAGSAFYVIEGGAPDGSNALAVELTGTPLVANAEHSASFVLQPDTYTVSMYIDASQATSGHAVANIRTLAGAVVASLVQPAGSSGVLTQTFTIGGAHNYAFSLLATGLNGPVETTVIWANPIIEKGSSISTVPINYPTTDQSLTIPAPLPFANNPPPISRMAEAFLDSFIMVDNQDPSKFWWSQQGLYELVGANSYQRTTTNVGTAIMQLVRMLDTLIILKERSMEQITTYPPPPPTAVDPQHGALSYRAGTPFGAGLMALMTHGLGRLALSQSLSEAQQIDASFQAALVGDDIKPIIDAINPAELHAQNLTTTLPSTVVLNALNLFLLAFKSSTVY